MRVADDRADPVRDNLRQLAVSGAASLVLIAAVLFGMLGRGRSVAAVAFSVLFSLALALAAMKPLGLSLNLLTLAGLAMVVGLLVDNAVVVVERLTEERRRHGPTKALRRTWGVVAVPLLGGTLTTLAVLAPLVWASGELHALFASFAVLTALTLLASLFAALLLVPLVIENGGPPTRRPTTRRWCPRGLDLPLAWANRWPLPTLVLLALLLGTPIHSLPEPLEEPARGWSPWHRQVAERYNATLGSDVFRDARRWLDPLLGGVLGPFLEQVHLGRRWSFTERPEVRARLTLPTGSGLGRSDRLIAELERRALGSPVVRHTLVRVSEDQATLRVLFDDGALASREPLRLRQELIETVLHWADVEVSIGGLVPQGFHSGLGEVASFVVEAHGPSWNTLGEVADTLDRRLRRDHRVVEVDTAAGPSGPTRGHEVLALGWPSDAQARTGVDPRSLAQRLRLRLWTHGASFEAILGETGESVPVRLQIAGSETWSLDDLLTTPLAAEGQAPVRLGDAAVLGRVRQPLAIERRDQQYRRILRVYYRGPRDQGEKLIDHELANLVPPPGHRLERPTDTFLTDTVRLQLWLLLAATALAVLLVMAAVFESWRLPWLVLVSLPLALVGVAMGFLWSGADFAEGAFIGLVLLTGIAVNDAILLVDRQRRLRRRRPHLDPGTLAHLAVRQRLRPMWTTTLTSIAGVAPLLLIAEAGDFWLGFAVTVAGGLASSTLLVPPAIVALCAGARRRPRSAPSRRAWRRPWALASD